MEKKLTIDQLVDLIMGLTLEELAKLSDLISERTGISWEEIMKSSAESKTSEVKTETKTQEEGPKKFVVVLTTVPATQKVAAIKKVSEVKKLNNLMGAKKALEDSDKEKNGQFSLVVGENLSKEDAEKLKAQFTEISCECEIKPV